MDLNLDVTFVYVEFILSLKDIYLSDGELLVMCLDCGIEKVFISIDKEEKIEEDKLVEMLFGLPRHRLGIHFKCLCLSDFEGKIYMDFSRVIKTFSVDITFLEEVKVDSLWSYYVLSREEDIEINFCISPDIKELSEVTFDLFQKTQKSKYKVFFTLLNPTPIQFGESYTACIKSDRKDKLYTTVVCDAQGHALGLVYSSKESVISSFETGRGVYYSRSRQSLWKKGDTSGHYQTLHRIDIDCDSDAVRFTVTQHGTPTPSFCHLKTLSCWGELDGLHQLQDTLQTRLQYPTEGSYTQRLFQDPELLQNKLLEESLELMEAKEKQHVAEELADVLYFALVQATKYGVTMDDAIKELNKRSKKVTRRKGDSKTSRIEQVNQIFEKKL